MYVCHSLVPQLSHPQYLSLAVLSRRRPGKTDHVQWRTWTLGGHCGGVVHSQKTASKWALDIRQSWWCFLGSESHFTAVQKEICHSSTRPPNIQVCHCIWSVLSEMFTSLFLYSYYRKCCGHVSQYTATDEWCFKVHINLQQLHENKTKHTLHAIFISSWAAQCAIWILGFAVLFPRAQFLPYMESSEHCAFHIRKALNS